MSSLSSPTLLDTPQIDSETPDSHLLGKFVADQDEAAFAALVQRHGGLVRGVCRRILLDPAASDDAFQQTFLSLAQHAQVLMRTVAPTASLGSWLYRVAVNASLQLKRKARSRRRRETAFAEHRPSAEAPKEPWNEVLPALDEEISALPGQYRLAVVKCHLEGKTQHDAAKELGITYATLRRRLKEARGMLRQRLSKRGFVQSGFVLLPVLAYLSSSSSVSAQTATAVTQTVLGGSSVPTAAATSAAASTGTGSLSLAGKFLAANTLVKSFLAGALMLGAFGGWWLVRSSEVSEPAQVHTVGAKNTDASATDATPKPGAKSADAEPQDDFLEAHFAYVFQNGHPISPELENAVAALNDSGEKTGEPQPGDLIDLPTLSSREMLRDVELSAPLPKNSDLLTQSDSAPLAEDVIKHPLLDPDAVLIAPTTPPKQDPLTVEQVMEFLNKEQDRRSQPGLGQAGPATSNVFGHPHSQPAQTLKVVPLP